MGRKKKCKSRTSTVLRGWHHTLKNSKQTQAKKEAGNWEKMKKEAGVSFRIPADIKEYIDSSSDERKKLIMGAYYRYAKTHRKILPQNEIWDMIENMQERETQRRRRDESGTYVIPERPNRDNRDQPATVGQTHSSRRNLNFQNGGRLRTF